jgi:hypothetical protein
MEGWKGFLEGCEFEVLDEIETLLFFLSTTLETKNKLSRITFLFQGKVSNPTYSRYLDTLTQVAPPPSALIF